MPHLESLGWNPFFQEQLHRLQDPDLRPARVAVEHRGRYELLGQDAVTWAELSGRLRLAARDPRDLPAVGDWVAVRHDQTICQVLERRSAFVRRPAGARVEAQVLAANINTVFVVTSFDLDFNPRRIERYVAAIWESGAEAVIVLNKADLVDDQRPWLDRLGPSVRGLEVLTVSALERRGLELLHRHILPGRTVALVGSSGVGKSALANWLMGRDAFAVGGLRSDGRGRHTTTRRELVMLPDGGLLIDTPGLRELKLWSEGEGIQAAFGEVEELARACRFGDCTHAREPGCAVRRAIEEGHLSVERWDNYLKLRRGQTWLDSQGDPVLKRNTKQRWKRISMYARQRAKARERGDNGG